MQMQMEIDIDMVDDTHMTDPDMMGSDIFVVVFMKIDWEVVDWAAVHMASSEMEIDCGEFLVKVGTGVVWVLGYKVLRFWVLRFGVLGSCVSYT